MAWCLVKHRDNFTLLYFTPKNTFVSAALRKLSSDRTSCFLFSCMLRPVVCFHWELFWNFESSYSLGGIFRRGIGPSQEQYEDISKSFRPGRLARELQMAQLSAIRYYCIAIWWVSLVSFASITLCVASWVFIVIVISLSTLSRNFWIHPRVRQHRETKHMWMPWTEFELVIPLFKQRKTVRSLDVANSRMSGITSNIFLDE
jgi:hypothetical protein